MKTLLSLMLLLTMLCGCTGAPVSASSDVTPAPATDRVDYSCRTDTDCAVKNVVNCCGAYPACVNANSPTFPDRVAEQCRKQGMSSVCGFPDISGCACIEGRCEADGNGGGGDVR